jgi:hypothetical protein
MDCPRVVERSYRLRAGAPSSNAASAVFGARLRHAASSAAVVARTRALASVTVVLPDAPHAPFTGAKLSG